MRIQLVMVKQTNSLTITPCRDTHVSIDAKYIWNVCETYFFIPIFFSRGLILLYIYVRFHLNIHTYIYERIYESTKKQTSIKMPEDAFINRSRCQNRHIQFVKCILKEHFIKEINSKKDISRKAKSIYSRDKSF